MTPYEVPYGFPPPIHILYFSKDSIVESVGEALTRRKDMIKRANRKKSERHFSRGDYVHLKLQPYRQQSTIRTSSQKLVAKFFGPYQIIEKIGNVAYKLELPPSAEIHPAFHISQLKMHPGNHPVQTTQPVLHRTPDLQPQDILDMHIARKKNRATTQFLVQRKGLPPADATWEFADELALRFPWLNLDDKESFVGGDCQE